MSTLRIGKSYWLDQYRGHAPRFPPMHGAVMADVAIVGGGLTGCLAAYLFADAGLRVVLLEAQRIGRGSTAASTALVMHEPDVNFIDLANRYGIARARRIWMHSRASVRGLTALLQRLRISATLQAVPSVRWTCDTNMSADMRRELARRRTAGLGGRWLTRAALKRETGIDGAGGILTRGNAQLDPYRACLGLAVHARAAGARLHELSSARRVIGDHHGVRIELDRGELCADWAVIATGYATPDFKPLAGRFRMSNTYVIATPQLAAKTRHEMGLGDLMLWDTNTPYHYARWTPDHRLFFGGGDEPKLARGARRDALDRHASRLMKDLVGLYPVLGTMSLSPEYAWEGLFATTPDGLPYISPNLRYPRHLFALGYGGNGMAFTFLAAQILLRAIRGAMTAEDRFFGFARIHR
jgi:glycine/D-amino acid oxidase-like deaminating enzyme